VFIVNCLFASIFPFLHRNFFCIYFFLISYCSYLYHRLTKCFQEMFHIKHKRENKNYILHSFRLKKVHQRK